MYELGIQTWVSLIFDIYTYTIEYIYIYVYSPILLRYSYYYLYVVFCCFPLSARWRMMAPRFIGRYFHQCGHQARNWNSARLSQERIGAMGSGSQTQHHSVSINYDKHNYLCTHVVYISYIIYTINIYNYICRYTR